MEVDGYPYTQFDENGDIECETCNKKFFAPGLCDTCFIDLIEFKKVEEERNKVLAILDELTASAALAEPMYAMPVMAILREVRERLETN